MVLFDKNVARHKMKRILSEKHRIGTYKKNKISLSCFDDKRHILDNGINSLAYFHENIDINREYSFYSKVSLLFKSIVVIQKYLFYFNKLHHFS